MKKRRIQSTNDGKSRVESFLDGFIEIPSSIRRKVVLLVVMAVVAIGLLLVSFRQYAPVVHKINIKGDNWHSATSLVIDAALYYGGDSWIRSIFLGKQYIHLHTLASDAPDVSSVPKEVTDAVPGTYTQYMSTTMTLSGRSFRPDRDIKVGKWGRENEVINGTSRLVWSNGKHSLTQESFFEEETGHGLADMFIRGSDIFSNTRSSNPYIAFHLTFDNISFDDSGSFINFYFTKDQTLEDKSKHYSAPLSIISIDPKPDSMDLDGFSYSTDLGKIVKDGIYVIIEDLGMKRKNDRELFFCSVFLGLVVSYIIQLLVSLILDIRNNERRKRLSESPEK
jgi:hypothetical protein